MKNRRLIVIWLALAASMFLMAACSASNSKTPNSSNPSSQEQEGDFSQGDVELPEVSRP